MPVSEHERPVFVAGTNRGIPGQVESAILTAAEAATYFSWLSMGDSVFIKPALNSGNPYPDTTSPIAVGAMIELLKNKGAGRVIVGDMPGIQHVRFSRDRGSGSTRELMEASGMAPAVLAAMENSTLSKRAGGTISSTSARPRAPTGRAA